MLKDSGSVCVVTAFYNDAHCLENLANSNDSHTMHCSYWSCKILLTNSVHSIGE